MTEVIAADHFGMQTALASSEGTELMSASCGKLPQDRQGAVRI